MSTISLEDAAAGFSFCHVFFNASNRATLSGVNCRQRKSGGLGKVDEVCVCVGSAMLEVQCKARDSYGRNAIEDAPIEDERWVTMETGRWMDVENGSKVGGHPSHMGGSRFPICPSMRRAIDVLRVIERAHCCSFNCPQPGSNRVANE